MSVLVAYRNSAQRLWPAQDTILFETDAMVGGIANWTGDGTDLKVIQNTPLANMQVLVESGRAYKGVMVSGEYRMERLTNTARVALTVPSNSSGSNRIDAVIARWKSPDEPNAQGDNVCTIEHVTGDGVTALSDEDIQAAIGANDSFWRLADLTVANAATQIFTVDIADTRPTGLALNYDLLDLPQASKLASTAAGEGASMIGVEDDDGNFAGDTVEEILAELQDNIETVAASGLSLANLRIYGDGSDGSPNWAAGATLDPTLDYQYTNVTLPVSQTLTVSSVNRTLIIRSLGNVTINGTIDLNSKGATAGNHGQSRVTGVYGAGAGPTGAGGSTGSPTWVGSNGGGGGSSMFGDGGTGGRGGGNPSPNATVSTPGGTPKSGAAALASFLGFPVSCGAGGGPGGSSGSAPGGAGGLGGGSLIWFISGNLTLGATAVIRANGGNGSNGTTAPSNATSGGGGGGGGGTIIFVVLGTISTTVGYSLTATAGSAGNGASNSGNGGAGAAGMVIIYSLTDGTILTS